MNRINIICLGVRDMERAIKFYKDGLGFETDEESYTPAVIFFNNKGTKLELFPLEALVSDINASKPPEIGTGFGGITLAYNAKTKEEVHEVMERAKKAGAQIVKEPEEVFWGGYSGYFKDLDDYYWEVAYAPGFQFDANDMIEDKESISLKEIVKAFWRDVADQKAEELKRYFALGAKVRWHTSNESFSVEEYIRANCEYPGDWKGEVQRIEKVGDLIISVARVWTIDQSVSLHVTSFFKFKNQLIECLDEYWGEDGSVPRWRKDKKIGVRIREDIDV